MIIGGNSIKGDYHDLNQDSFICEKHEDIFILAVSDGLGSKKDSKTGSKALCDSVKEISIELNEELELVEIAAFSEKIYRRWISKVEIYDVKQCYATMLVIVMYKNRAMIFRLGDGFVGVWVDNEVIILFDDKEEYFANETDCLSEIYNPDKVEMLEITFENFSGCILASDGLGIGDMTKPVLNSFVSEFIKGYRTMKDEEIESDIRSWLRAWPGSDDKTLAYIIAERNLSL